MMKMKIRLKKKKRYIKRQQNEKTTGKSKGDEIPLFDDEDDEDKTNSTSSTSNNEILNDKTQKVIPLYAEPLIITKNGNRREKVNIDSKRKSNNRIS